jgi:hypothetical protein
LCQKLRGSAWPAKFQLLKAEILLAESRLADVTPLLEHPPDEATLSPELQARLLMNRAELRRQSGQPDEARSLLAKARPLAAQANASTLLAWIELTQGLFSAISTKPMRPFAAL